MDSGTLYVCATPIGNLEDVSIRLLKTLRAVDIIACEDTRHTLKLLNRYKIKKRLLSYHEHSGSAREDHLVAELKKGLDIALVSDAGMPGISDPGERLVKKAIAAGIKVDVIPGPSACTAALAISGLDSTAFVFVGFLPNRRQDRRGALNDLKNESRTVILYEAPHRLLDTLSDLEEVRGPDQKLVIARELTKQYQQMQHDTVKELREYYELHSPRGEFCLLLPGQIQEAKAADLEQIISETAELIYAGMEKKEAFKMKAHEYGIKKSILYKHFVDNPL